MIQPSPYVAPTEPKGCLILVVPFTIILALILGIGFVKWLHDWNVI